MRPVEAKNAAAKAWNSFNLAAFTVGAEAANAINVAVQLKDAQAVAVQQVCVVEAYLSDNTDGSTLTATVPTSTVTIGTNGKILAVTVTDKVFKFITDSSGRFDFNIPQTAVKTYYLVLRLPDGSVLVSGAIAFA